MKNGILSLLCAFAILITGNSRAAEGLACDAAEAAFQWIDLYSVKESRLGQLSDRPILIIDTFQFSTVKRLPRPRGEKRSDWRKFRPLESTSILSVCELAYARNEEMGFIIPRSEDARFDKPESTHYSWRAIDGIMTDSNGRIILRVYAWREGVGTIYATVRYDSSKPEQLLDVLKVTEVIAS